MKKTNPRGAGRPKGIETTTIRIPLFLKPIIERYVKRKRTQEEILKQQKNK